jgi:hypothetical protein
MEEDDEIVTYHIKEVFPLYNLEYDIIVGNTMKDCIEHGESFFKGASLKKALQYDHYTCKMTHTSLKTKYMLIMEIGSDEKMANSAIKLATELSWHFMDELNIECNNTNNQNQAYFIMEIYSAINNALALFLEKIDPTENNLNNNIGDL